MTPLQIKQRKSSNKRVAAYLVLIGLLSFLVFDTGLSSVVGGGVKELAIFQPPKDTSLGSFDLDKLSRNGDATKTPQPKRDQFEDDLRRLAAASGGGDVGVDSASGAVLSPTATPLPKTGVDSVQQGQVGQLEPDDGRSIFSELQPQEGSRVDDPLGGVVIRNPRLALPVVTPELTPIGRSWVGGQARGYTMLYAMQAEARPVVEANVEALLGAKVREPYIGVLIDGTFSRDFAYLKDIISRLSADGRALSLVLYLSNGPTMRKWDVTPIDQHIFARISPEEFRLQIRRNMTLRAEFLAVVLQAKDVFTHNLSQGSGNTNTAIVMLEDNLDVLAYRSLREIAAEQLGSIAGFMRNPCVGCLAGNDDDTLGDAREEHALNRFDLLKAGDGYSLDGVSFKYPDGTGSGVASEQLTEMLRESSRKGLRFYGLWREEWQGVKEGVPNKRPEERSYQASLPDQQAFEIDVLRTGLTAEESEPSGEPSSELSGDEFSMLPR